MAKRSKIDEEISSLTSEKTELENKLNEIKNEDDKPVEDKQKLDDINSKLMEVEEQKIDIYKEYGKKQKIVSQLFDLALLSNNLLKGESLSNFVSRSVDLLKK